MLSAWSREGEEERERYIYGRVSVKVGEVKKQVCILINHNTW